jgi:hypothetical protein
LYIAARVVLCTVSVEMTGGVRAIHKDGLRIDVEAQLVHDSEVEIPPGVGDVRQSRTDN